MKRAFLLLLIILLAPLSRAAAQSPYYQGKTITIITGSQTGDVFDIYARMIAAHMGKHIPGNPNLVVQNMTGAGHIVAANFVYSVAKPDGLTLLAPNPNLYVDQLIGRPEIKFDWAKFSWLGNASAHDGHALHALRRSIQNHGRCAQRQGAAQMRRHRNRHHRIHGAAAVGGDDRREV